MIPVALLYTIPEDAANEIAYVYKRKYPVSWIEMGEEADGQRVLPEDYATLYLQFAKAIHKLTPESAAGRAGLRRHAGRCRFVGGRQRPRFVSGPVSGLSQGSRPSPGLHLLLLRALPVHGRRRCAEWNSLYWEPAYVNRVIQAWKDNGLPPNVPFFMTEGNDLGEGGPGTVKAGLWLADYVGSMLTAGAAAPTTSTTSPAARGGGFLPIDENNRVRYYPPQYLAAQVITKEWVQPVDAVHKLYKVASDVKDKDGNILVTAYAVERPDGLWSVMLINKDQDNDHSVKVAFADPAAGRNRSFSGSGGPRRVRSRRIPVSSRSGSSRRRARCRPGRRSRRPWRHQRSCRSGRTGIQIDRDRQRPGHHVSASQGVDHRAAWQDRVFVAARPRHHLAGRGRSVIHCGMRGEGALIFFPMARAVRSSQEPPEPTKLSARE